MNNGTPRRLFEELPDTALWLSGSRISNDSNSLITLSNDSGESTILITPQRIVSANAKMFVQAPPERVLSGANKRFKKLSDFFVVVGYALAVVLLSFSALSMTGLVKARVVLTGSMSPTINPGDIVVTVNPKNYPPKTLA